MDQSKTVSESQESSHAVQAEPSATSPGAGTSVIVERAPRAVETTQGVNGSCTLPLAHSSKAPFPAAGDPQVCSTPQQPPRPQSAPLPRNSVPTPATQQPVQKKNKPVGLSDNTERNDNYLKSCIEVNNAKVEKLKLEIKLLKKQLKDDESSEGSV